MIGSTVWFYDVNHREYTKPEEGRIWGTIIERAHWRPRKVVSETSRSWITDRGDKLPKKDDWGYLWLRSEDAITSRAWARQHARRIADKVRGEKRVDVLRRVADMIGYEGTK